MDVDVLIVGGGPAGSNAALVLARSRRSVLLCDDGKPRNAASHALHGLLAHDGEEPEAFREKSRASLKRYPAIAVREDRVVALSGQDGAFDFELMTGAKGRAAKVLLATGITDELPQLPGIEDYYGLSVHHCLYCDGYEYRDKNIAAYGEPKRVVELAMLMRQWSPKILLCTDGAALTAEQHERLKCTGIIACERKVTELSGNSGQLASIQFDDGTSRDCAALFFLTSSRPSSRLGDSLGCDPKGGLLFRRPARAACLGCSPRVTQRVTFCK